MRDSDLGGHSSDLSGHCPDLDDHVLSCVLTPAVMNSDLGGHVF